MIFQHFHLLDSRTVLDNVAFPLEIRGIDKARREKRALEILEIVGLVDRAKEHPSRLSGGMKQRVGIARALAGSPRVLLCDEATSALDTRTAHQILALLRDVNEAFGVTVVLITHDMEVVRAACGSAALLSDGPDRRVRPAHRPQPRPGVGPGSPAAAAARGAGRAGGAAPAADGGRRRRGVRGAQPAGPRPRRRRTIRAGSIERIAGHDVGRFQVDIASGTPGQGAAATDAVVRYLSERDVRTEVLA